MKKPLSIIVVVLSVASCLFAQDSAQSNGKSANVAGAWRLSWQTPHGKTMSATLQIQQDDSKLSGEAKIEDDSKPMTGSVHGDQVSFTITVKTWLGARSVMFKGTVEGDKMSGANSRGRSWTATRQ